MRAGKCKDCLAHTACREATSTKDFFGGTGNKRIMHRCSKHGYEHMNSTFYNAYHMCCDPAGSEISMFTDEQVLALYDENRRQYGNRTDGKSDSISDQ